MYELIELASFQGDVEWISLRLLLPSIFTSLDTSVPYIHTDSWETESTKTWIKGGHGKLATWQATSFWEEKTVVIILIGRGTCQ